MIEKVAVGLMEMLRYEMLMLKVVRVQVALAAKSFLGFFTASILLCSHFLVGLPGLGFGTIICFF